MKDFFLRLISDEKGNLSSARFLNLLVGICACAFSWKLVLMGGYNENYFALLLAYGSGTFAAGKWMEKRNEAADTRGGADTTKGGAG